jgi:hypothetical protein
MIRVWFLCISLCLVSIANAAPPLVVKGHTGTVPENWTRDYSLSVDDPSEIIVIGESAAGLNEFDSGTMSFVVLAPDGSELSRVAGGGFTSGPGAVNTDGQTGTYKIRVTASNALGKWQFQATTVRPRALETSELICGILMVVVALLSIALCQIKLRVRWRWYWIGAGLWMLGVAMKLAFAIAMNQRVLGFLLAHLGPRAYQVAGSIYIGLLTGVFEVGIVALAALIWRGMSAKAGDAIAIGVGAGAIEAALLGLGMVGTMAAALAGAGNNLIAGAALMTAVTPLAWLVGPVERALAILCHIAARTTALYGVASRRWWPFWIGFALLSLVDTIAGWTYVAETLGTSSLWWLEAAIAPLAIVSIPLIGWAARRWPRSTPANAALATST